MGIQAIVIPGSWFSKAIDGLCRQHSWWLLGREVTVARVYMIQGEWSSSGGQEQTQPNGDGLGVPRDLPSQFKVVVVAF